MIRIVSGVFSSLCFAFAILTVIASADAASRTYEITLKNSTGRTVRYGYCGHQESENKGGHVTHRHGETLRIRYCGTADYGLGIWLDEESDFPGRQRTLYQTPRAGGPNYEMKSNGRSIKLYDSDGDVVPLR